MNAPSGPTLKIDHAGEVIGFELHGNRRGRGGDQRPRGGSPGPPAPGPAPPPSPASRNTASAPATTPSSLKRSPLASCCSRRWCSAARDSVRASPSRGCRQRGVERPQLPVAVGGLGPAFRRGEPPGLRLQAGEPALPLVAVELGERGARARIPGAQGDCPVQRGARLGACARPPAPRGPGPSPARSRPPRAPHRAARWRPGPAPIPRPASARRRSCAQRRRGVARRFPGRRFRHAPPGSRPASGCGQAPRTRRGSPGLISSARSKAAVAAGWSARSKASRPGPQRGIEGRRRTGGEAPEAGRGRVEAGSGGGEIPALVLAVAEFGESLRLEPVGAAPPVGAGGLRLGLGAQAFRERGVGGHPRIGAGGARRRNRRAGPGARPPAPAATASTSGPRPVTTPGSQNTTASTAASSATSAATTRTGERRDGVRGRRGRRRIAGPAPPSTPRARAGVRTASVATSASRARTAPRLPGRQPGRLLQHRRHELRQRQRDGVALPVHAEPRRHLGADAFRA